MRHVLFPALICIALNSCNNTPTEPKSLGNYPGSVSAIIQANCLGGNCHSGPTTVNTQFDLSTWETMKKGSIYFNEIIPFSAVKSHFFGHINTNSGLGPVITPTMPLARDPLSTADQMTLFNWINQGAKSAEGKIPYDDITKRIFVSNRDEDMISVIDAETKRLVRVLSVGTKYLPVAVSMMPDLKAFIVAMDGATGIIRKYDAGSYGQIGEFASHLYPSEIAITSDGSKGYIADDSYYLNRFGVFDPVTMKLGKTVSTPLVEDAVSVVISPDGKYAYLCGHRSDNILRIDTRTDSVMGCLTLGADVQVPYTSSYPTKYGPEKIVVSSDSKTLYVTCLNTSEVVVFDLVRDSIIARIPIPSNPWGEALSPDGSELWIATWGANSVHVVSTATNQVIAKIDSVSLVPHAITITPDGAYAYVACELASGGAHHHGTGATAPSSFVIIDCKTRKIVSIEELPSTSTGIVAGYK